MFVSGRSLGETRDGRDGRVRAEVEEQLLGGQPPRPAVVQRHLDRLRRDETGGSHDQLRAAGLVAVEVKGDQTVDHVALALEHLLHVDRDRTGLTPNSPARATMPATWRSRSRSCWAGS